MNLIDIGRRLTIRDEILTEGNASKLIAETLAGSGQDETWDAALIRKVLFLIGPAHAGKTSELNLLHQRLHGQGRYVFSIQLKTLLDGTFITSVPRDERVRYAQWKSSDDEAYFLLDSVDEVELYRSSSFEKCIRTISAGLNDTELSRTHWVISTRPGSWLSERTLKTVRLELTVDHADKSAIVLAALRPLDHQQRRRLMSEAFGVENPIALEEVANNAGLMFALSNPGNLRWISTLAKHEAPPRSRVQAFEFAIDELVKPRDANSLVPPDELRQELESLAAACVLCEMSQMGTRDAEKTGEYLPLRQLLSHQPPTFEHLLKGLPLLDDSGFERIKFVPEQIQAFLAAKWLARRAVSQAERRDLATRLFIVPSMAGPMIPTHLLATAGWLTTLLPAFRESIVEVAPHVVLYLGDLGELPNAQAAQAHTRVMERLASGNPLFPSWQNFLMTDDDYWHVGKPSFHPHLVKAFVEFSEHELCVERMLEVFRVRKVEGIVPHIRELLERDINPRLRHLCIRGLVTCGSSTDIEWAIGVEANRGLTQQSAILLAEAIVRTNASSSSFLAARDGLAGAGLGFEYPLTVAIEETSALNALSFLIAMEAQLRTLNLTDDDCNDVNVDLYIVVGLAKGVLSHAEVPEQLRIPLLAVLEQLSEAAPHGFAYDPFDAIRVGLIAHPALRASAIIRVASRTDEEQSYFALISNNTYVRITVDDGEVLAGLLKLELQPNCRRVLTRLLAAVSASQSVKPTADVKKQGPQAAPLTEVEIQNAKWLNENSIRISDSQAPEVYQAADFAVREFGGLAANWPKFEAKYGIGASMAIQQGAMKYWRTFMMSTSARAETRTALMGLQLELREGEGVATGLSSHDATLALHIGLRSEEGLPIWFDILARAQPPAFWNVAHPLFAKWKATGIPAKGTAGVVNYLARSGQALGRSRVAGSDALRIALSGEIQDYSALSELLSIAAAHLGNDARQLQAVERRAASLWEDTTSLNGGMSLWFELWMKLRPEAVVFWLEQKSQQERADLFAERIARLAVGEGGFFGETGSTFNGVRSRCDLLERLYRVLDNLPTSEPEPIRIGVQSGRGSRDPNFVKQSLVTSISELGGPDAMDALRRIALRGPVYEWEFQWLVRLARKVAEASAKRARWTVSDFLKFRELSATPVDTTPMLWGTVGLDLDEVIRNLNEGRFAIRELLHKGIERDMQLWLSRELQLLSRDRYRVTREQEFGDATTPDLEITAGSNSSVVLELKVGDARSLPSLIDDLTRQLHDDYMKDEAATHGFFVVMYKAKNSEAKRRAQTNAVDKVRKGLQQRADELNRASTGRKTIGVRCFVCPLARSPRHELN